MAEIKLKPCPFCGGEAHLFQNKPWYVVVQCFSCGAQIARQFNKIEELSLDDRAVAAWNRRIEHD